MRNKKFIIIFSILCSLTFIIVMSGAIFSVQHVYEHCSNGDSVAILDVNGETTLSEKVLSSHGFKKGKSIFLTDTNAAIKKLEAEIPSIKVTSIERKFPNRIYITYELLFEYLQVHSGGNYYILSDECKITNVVNQRYDDNKIVHTYISGDIGEPKAGEILTSTRAGEIEALSEILLSLKRLGQSYYGLTQMFEFIDLRDEYEFIFLKTTTGVYFKLIDWTDIDLKLQCALSLYRQKDKESDVYKYRNEGTIIVSNTKNFFHTDEIQYNP